MNTKVLLSEGHQVRAYDVYYLSVVTLKSWKLICIVSAALMRLLDASVLDLLFESGFVSS
jgi:hypothetical protein